MDLQRLVDWVPVLGGVAVAAVVVTLHFLYTFSDRRQKKKAAAPSSSTVVKPGQDLTRLINSVPGMVYSFKVDAKGKRSFPFVFSADRAKMFFPQYGALPLF